MHASGNGEDVFVLEDDFLVLHFNKDSGRILLPDTNVVSNKPLDYYGLHRINKSGVVKWSKYFNWPFTGFGYAITNQRVAGSTYIYYLNRVYSGTRLYKIELDGNLVDSIGINANVNRVVIDGNGKLILTGQFWGDFNFQGKNISMANTASPFILKLTDDLDYLWLYNLSENDSWTSVECLLIHI